VTALLLMAFLFLSEFWAFLTPELSHEMFVDSPLDTGDKHGLCCSIACTLAP
jgi:hypothetical protein